VQIELTASNDWRAEPWNRITQNDALAAHLMAAQRESESSLGSAIGQQG
jgi:hypothetical protein